MRSSRVARRRGSVAGTATTLHDRQVLRTSVCLIPLSSDMLPVMNTFRSAREDSEGRGHKSGYQGLASSDRSRMVRIPEELGPPIAYGETLVLPKRNGAVCTNELPPRQ